MKKNIFLQFQWNKVLFILFFSLFFISKVNVFASFTPGQTLDPNCAPGAVGCIVTSASGSSLWTDSSGDIYFTGGKVGVGTNSPTSVLSLKENIATIGSDLISNGTFDTNSLGWNLYDSSVYNSGKLTVTYTGAESWADVSTDITTESGKTYLVTFDLSGVSKDSVYFYFDNNSFSPDYDYGNGNVSISFTSDYTGLDAIYFESYDWNNNSTWSIDNVSIKEINTPVDNPIFEILDNNNKSIISLGGVSNLVSIGKDAGSDSLASDFSNFIGTKAGYLSNGSHHSNFIGAWAGQNSLANNSNFLGLYAGQSTSANNSNFLGYLSGQYATNASYSNFLGSSAGSGATNANNSNFLGSNTGKNATNANNSNFLGVNTGNNATEAHHSNFLGYSAGSDATNANNSNFLGSSAGYFATGASDSNFIGTEAGYLASSATKSNFIGSLSGSNSTNASSSNFIGYYAGVSATNASYSNFIGENSGLSATDAIHSNFLGYKSGETATTASFSNFLGHSSGLGASLADHSNFLGSSAGKNATNANDSNFFGLSAGSGATNANNSNFFGNLSGSNATNASNSTFIGYFSGISAINASNSIFIGKSAGQNDAVDNTGNANDFSILIGNLTSTGGFENSIALGGSAVNTASNQFMIGSTTRPIDTTRWNGSASTQCTLTTGSGVACTSDERLKTDITDLSTDTLDKLKQVRTVNFKWLEGDRSKNNIGFLAQDLEIQFPELVATDLDGYKSVYYANMTPVLVEAIRELDLKVENFSSLDTTQSNSVASLMKNFLGNIGNNLEIVFFGEVHTKKLCLEDICITKDQLEKIINQIPSVAPTENTTNTKEEISVTTEDGILEDVDDSVKEEVILPADPIVEETEKNTETLEVSENINLVN